MWAYISLISAVLGKNDIIKHSYQL